MNQASEARRNASRKLRSERRSRNRSTGAARQATRLKTAVIVKYLFILLPPQGHGGRITEGGDEPAGEPLEIQMDGQGEADDQGAQPNKEGPPVEGPALFLRQLAFKPEKREEPVLGEDDGPDGHEDESVDRDIIEQLEEKEREAGEHSGRRPREQGDLPTGPAGGNGL